MLLNYYEEDEKTLTLSLCFNLDLPFITFYKNASTSRKDE